MRMLRTPLLALALCALPAAAFAAPATPSPKPGAPVRIDVLKIQPKALLPKQKLHSEFTVETNRLGQVTRVRSAKNSRDLTFNAQTYGNALQAFIRTPDGRAVAGTYKLTYDYDPKTARVHRDVELLRSGGVDPNTTCAALDIIRKAHARPSPSPGPAVHAPHPRQSLDAGGLPDLHGIMRPTPMRAAR